MPLTADRIQKRVQDLANLPTLSGVVRFVSSLADQDQTTAQDLGKVIAKDQVLSAKILRLVNSPFYGFPGRISSVSHAIVLLGFNVVKGLALSTSVFEALARESEGLWQHSLGTAVLSRKMAKELNLPDPEEIMIAGLLHDLGKVVLAHFSIEDYRAVIAEAKARRVHIAVVEQEHFDVDHARVGAWVAEAWHLPDRLTVVMAHHHHPARAKAHKETVAAIHLADVLARGMGYGDPGDNVLPTLDHDAFHMLGLSYHRIEQILVEAEKEYNSGVDLFRDGR